MFDGWRTFGLMVATVVLLIPTISVAQDWFELYEDGKKLVQAGQYLKAEDLLLKSKDAAARADRQPGPAVLRYGSLRVPFFPDYYLGIVYLNTKRAKEAMQAFDLARSQKIPNNRPDFRDLDQLYARATNDLAAANANNVTRGGPPPGRGETPPATPPAPITPAGPSPADRKQFDGLLAKVQQLLKGNNFAEARRVAGQARDLNVDNGRVDGLINDINASESNFRAEEKRRADAAAGAEREKETNSRAAQVDAAIKARDLTRARTALANLTAYAPDYARLNDFKSSIATIERTVALNTAERQAMEAYFGGNYTNALRVITDVEQKIQGPLSPRAYLYKACSLAALALQAKTTDKARLSEAVRAFRQASAARAQLARDLEYISPRIRLALGAS